MSLLSKLAVEACCQRGVQRKKHSSLNLSQQTTKGRQKTFGAEKRSGTIRKIRRPVFTTKPTKCREKTFVTRKSSKNVRQNRQTVATQNTESREKKLFVKSPVFDVGKGPVFDGGNDGGNDGGKGPVFDVEIVSTLSPLHNHTSAVALSAVTSH